jgi:tetratricopeptide (TPR) repeat protein
MRSDLKKAEDHIQKALAIHPFWPDANYELGLVYAERGKKDEALEYLKRAQIIWEDADPDYEPALKTREKMAELEASAM